MAWNWYELNFCFAAPTCYNGASLTGSIYTIDRIYHWNLFQIDLQLWNDFASTLVWYIYYVMLSYRRTDTGDRGCHSFISDTGQSSTSLIEPSLQHKIKDVIITLRKFYYVFTWLYSPIALTIYIIFDRRLRCVLTT